MHPVVPARKRHSFWRRLLRPALDFFYPNTCLACNRLLEEEEEHVCRPCWESIDPVTPTLLLYLQTLQYLRDGGLIVSLNSLYVFDKEKTLQKILHAFKYQNFQSLGVRLGDRLAAEIIPGVFDMVIPIPLHPVRLRERGYNQAAVLAQQLASVADLNYNDALLRRVRNTPSQTHMNAAQRSKNMSGAFACANGAAGALKGRNILLVDDLITTGATMRSAALVIRQAGASIVGVASVAIAR